MSPILFGVLLAWVTPQASFANAPQDSLNHYLRLQGALARDSMQNVSANAQALAEAARGDETPSLPPALARQADVLAKSNTIAQARQAFKPVSESLIAYFKTNRVPPGTYYEVYCPIAKAGWLQTGGTMKNPYLGPRSATPTWGWACAGVVKTIFASPSACFQSGNADAPFAETGTCLVLCAEQTGYPVGKINVPGIRGLYAPGNGALFSGSKAAGFTFAFSRSSRSTTFASANGSGGNGEWQNREVADFNQFSEGQIWGGDDANRKPQGHRLVSWNW